MEEMRESHRGERRQGIGAVQGIVHPFTAPPARGNWARRKKKSQASDCCGLCGSKLQQTLKEALQPGG